ncbi:MAG TPA: XrtA/PEP-CTERM system histidine kinase PrsK [Sphingomicrobium sp.]|nr:XrtA/PEP-CTERM system histidine kinase PrsK [Sphingomicrobium sp.]
MSSSVAFWSHALATAMFATLVLWEVRRGIHIGGGQRVLLAALALTACWAWLTALEPSSILADYSETARNLVWVGVLYRLAEMGAVNDRQRGVKPVYAAVACVLSLQMAIDALSLLHPDAGATPTLVSTATLLRLTAAAGSLVLVHNLYAQAAPASRGSIRLAMLALALMWAFDLNLYTVAFFSSASADVLFEWRGLAVAATAPFLALGGARGEGWQIRLSRAATFQSLSLLAICAYFATMAVIATVLRGTGIVLGRDVAVALMAVMTLAALVLLPSSRARGWLKVKLAKHLFEHRYDYRAEWLRFTQTLGAWGPGAAPLGERVVKAFADILDAPGGILLTLEEGATFSPAADWHWPGAAHPAAAAGHEAAAAFWRAIANDGRIVNFEARRGGWDGARDARLAIPAALLAEPNAWAGIPLIHEERLIALVVLAAPDYQRALDWEDYDLLRTAGRQAASTLAEAHGQQAIADVRQFDDFNRRFAFILHDIKNLVSQLTLVSRNAERHSENPEFRADMIATLKGSVGKMNELLSRIGPQREARELNLQPIELRGLLSAAVASCRRRHDVHLSGDTALTVIADPAALEQAISHLLNNAIDASPRTAPVSVRVVANEDGASIAIADKGAGMDADFIRNRLFQPFASTKHDGFGIGAFEARSLIAAMGGRLAVDSRPGRGTRFTISLPLPRRIAA